MSHPAAAKAHPQPSSFEGAFVINEDNCHFFNSRPPEEMTEDGLHAFIDQYADGAVTHLFLCPNAQRASFRSRSREAIWDPATLSLGWQWEKNAKLLHDRGLDPYAIWIQRAREKHLSPWLSMRMNDIHNVIQPELSMHSAFWREHPEFWVVPHATTQRWQDRALDFQYPEVRQHAMDFLEELLERYDPDGIELDWMRFGFHFPPGREHAFTEVLTQFMREARSRIQAAAENRGHPIGLAARVPVHPDASRGLGMDAVTWAEEELVDVLIVAPFWRTTDFDIPIELWRERLTLVGSAIPVLPGIEHNSRPFIEGDPVPNDLPALYGWAASAYHRGAAGIYLFNWMDSQTIPIDPVDYPDLVREGLDPQRLSHAPRRNMVTFRDTVPHGFPDNQVLPADPAGRNTFTIPIGPLPASGTARLVVGLSIDDAAVQLTAVLNGNGPLPNLHPATIKGLGGGTVGARQVEIPLSHLVPGTNCIVLSGNPIGPQNKIVWVELRIDP